MDLSAKSNNESLPHIFKLNTDCFNEIFEYLSLKELHSIAKTCKTLKIKAGEYYQQNYKAAKISVGMRNIHNFRQYIQYIICDYFYFSKESFGLPFVTLDSIISDFTSVKHLQLSIINSNIFNSKKLRKFLSKVEVLKLSGWRRGQSNFFVNLLKTCKNLKRFSLETNLRGMNGEWLHKNYPKLEHIELIQLDVCEVDDFISFLDLNPQIQSFSTDSRWFLANKIKFLQVNLKLDELKIKHIDYGDDKGTELNWKEIF